MKIKTMIMFTNNGTLEFKDEYNVMNFFQFNPYYVFRKCDDDELKEEIIPALMKKYPNTIFTFTISFSSGDTGRVHISKNNKPYSAIAFNFSDVIEIEGNNNKKDYYKLTKVLSIIE